jgi:paraquat-inducible protein B
MAKRVSSAAIGGFVTAGFFLLLLAIAVVGAGAFFKKPVRFVCMFEGDVNGLRIGAPVKFKGVQIGTVEEIKLVLPSSEGKLRPDLHDLRLPVIIGIDREVIRERGATGEALSGAGFEAMITRGLRAQLNTESLLTGLLYVDLDLHPNSPLNFALVPNSGNLQEIPTVPTAMEAIQKHATEAIAKLDTLDLKTLVAAIIGAANSINQLASSPDLKQTLAALKETIPNSNETITSVRVSLADIKDKLIPLAESIQSNSLQANATMKDTSATLVELRGMLEPNAPLSVHLNEALDELADTTRSVGTLSDYLQRNPSALVRGKYVPEKDQ